MATSAFTTMTSSMSLSRTAREYERDRQGTFAFSIKERKLKVLRTHFKEAGTSRLRQSFRACDMDGAGLHQRPSLQDRAENQEVASLKFLIENYVIERIVLAETSATSKNLN